MTRTRSHALLLDLDGTLVDTWPDLRAAAEFVLSRSGRLRERADLAMARVSVSRGALGILEALGDPAPDAEELVREMIDYYGSHATVRSRPFDGTEHWWQGRDVAIVTNKPRALAAPIVDHFFGERDPVLVCPEDAGAAKPDPAPVRLALERLGRPAAEAVLVGDDRRDWEAAEAAGVRFVAAMYGYTEPSEWAGVPPQPQITAPKELKGVLRRWDERLAEDDGGS